MSEYLFGLNNTVSVRNRNPDPDTGYGMSSASREIPCRIEKTFKKVTDSKGEERISQAAVIIDGGLNILITDEFSLDGGTVWQKIISMADISDWDGDCIYRKVYL